MVSLLGVRHTVVAPQTWPAFRSCRTGQSSVSSSIMSVAATVGTVIWRARHRPQPRRLRRRRGLGFGGPTPRVAWPLAGDPENSDVEDAPASGTGQPRAGDPLLKRPWLKARQPGTSTCSTGHSGPPATGGTLQSYSLPASPSRDSRAGTRRRGAVATWTAITDGGRAALTQRRDRDETLGRICYSRGDYARRSTAHSVQAPRATPSAPALAYAAQKSNDERAISTCGG